MWVIVVVSLEWVSGFGWLVVIGFLCEAWRGPTFGFWCEA